SQPYKNLVLRFSRMIECKSSEIHSYEGNIDNDFMKHDKLVILVTDCFQWLVLCFCSLGQMTYLVAYAFHQDKASSVRVPVANFTLFSSAQLLRVNTDSVCSNHRMRVSLGLVFPLGLSVFAMVVACASKAAAIPSVISCQMAA
nr:hypothetical protein [Tanacetum cinerariifolium]